MHKVIAQKCCNTLFQEDATGNLFEGAEETEGNVGGKSAVD